MQKLVVTLLMLILCSSAFGYETQYKYESHSGPLQVSGTWYNIQDLHPLSSVTKEEECYWWVFSTITNIANEPISVHLSPVKEVAASYRNEKPLVLNPGESTKYLVPPYHALIVYLESNQSLPASIIIPDSNKDVHIVEVEVLEPMYNNPWYSSSSIRNAVLAVLIAAICIMAFLLLLKTIILSVQKKEFKEVFADMTQRLDAKVEKCTSADEVQELSRQLGKLDLLGSKALSSLLKMVKGVEKEDEDKVEKPKKKRMVGKCQVCDINKVCSSVEYEE